MFSKSLALLCSSLEISYSICRVSQNWLDVPKNLVRRIAVLVVIARLPFMISEILEGVRFRCLDRKCGVMPMGIRNSSFKIYPGCVFILI